MEIRRTHIFWGAVILAVVTAWAGMFFLRGGRRFALEERRDLTVYAARRYVIAWALFGPDGARATLRGIMDHQDMVTSVTFDEKTAGFTVGFVNREQFAVQLPELPPRAFAPWWSLTTPFLIWGGILAWKERKRRQEDRAAADKAGKGSDGRKEQSWS